MKLSRLEIFGFKSFAKKLDLRLSGGITAVVGPNGCGKTNVVDAIRWVLGEQRPTQIRLERMEDVLFKGSANRHRLGMSEVSLTIDNDCGILGMDMPEVTITRRLFRSGESEYLINRKACRLADINDMLMDTGMGTDSYSVFELSMINAILSDKTDDRRNIFEEAAGVTKYKARRKSALNKLISIEDDLDRVGDIIMELQRRVDSLRRQAAKARRYRRFKGEIRERAVALAAFEIDRRKKKAAGFERELADLGAAVESLRVRISTNTAGAEILNADIVGVEKELEEIARSFGESMGAITEQEKEIARMDSRLESLDEIAARAREVLHRNTTELEKLAEKHGDCAGALSEVSLRLSELDKTYEGVLKTFKSLSERVNERSDERDRLEKEYRLIEQELANHRAVIANVGVKRGENERRLEDINRRLAELEKTLVELNGRLGDLEVRKLRIMKDIRDVTSKIEELKGKLETRNEELNSLDDDLMGRRERSATLRAEKEFLEEIIRSYEGCSEGVKNAVRSERLDGRVLGVLGDVVSTDDRYVPAVEAALRDSLETVLVTSTDDAVGGVRYLMEDSRGRAAFAAVEGADDTDGQPAVETTRGVIGPAHRFVRTEGRFMPVVRRYLRDVVIVDTLETALELRKGSSNGIRYATLDGILVGRYGELHGGHAGDRGKQTIGRREKLKTLEDELAVLDAGIAELTECRRKLSDDRNMLRGLIEELGKTVDSLRREHSECASSEAGAAARKDAVVDSIESLKSEAAAIGESFESFDSEKSGVELKLADKQRAFDELAARLEKAESELGELRFMLDRQRSEVTSLEIERAALAEKRLSLVRELDSIGERREALAQAVTGNGADIERAEREILEVGDLKKKTLADLASLERDHESLKRKKDDVEKRCNDLRSRRSDSERDLQQLRRELDGLTRKESTLTLARDEAVMLMNNIRDRLADEYYIDADDIPGPPDDPDFDPEQEKLLLEDLRRKLHALGDVNLAAETDYEQEKERLDFLERERNDLLEAGNTLRETITKINKIAHARFNDTFERIRINFRNMFQEFFDGGVCDLAMEEGTDPLEADITITARPPGKNVRSINLLSSGERALTAISLLFAIYLVKPSPFCILDEVDAPLDDANLDRYIRVIRRFSEKTQFIMVTHNKKTMAAADNLYGITMEEPGLSTLVSVRLSDVDPGGDGNGDRAKEEAAATA